MARALSLGLAHDLQIDAPYSNASKADIVRRAEKILAAPNGRIRPVEYHDATIPPPDTRRAYR